MSIKSAADSRQGKRSKGRQRGLCLYTITAKIFTSRPNIFGNYLSTTLTSESRGQNSLQLALLGHVGIPYIYILGYLIYGHPEGAAPRTFEYTWYIDVLFNSFEWSTFL